MTTPPVPYRSRNNGDLITADDWNEIQIESRKELYNRGVRYAEAVQSGPPVDDGGVPVLRYSVDSADAWAAVPGLRVSVVLPVACLVELSVVGLAKYDLAMLFFVEDNGRGLRAPTRLPPGVLAGAGFDAAAGWPERLAALAQLVAGGTSPRALSQRPVSGTSQLLRMTDRLVVPAGDYTFTLECCGSGDVTNALLQLTATPTV